MIEYGDVFDRPPLKSVSLFVETWLQENVNIEMFLKHAIQYIFCAYIFL